MFLQFRRPSDPIFMDRTSELDFVSECLQTPTKVPSSFRGLLLVKVGPQNSEGTLIGSCYPHEILTPTAHDSDDSDDNDVGLAETPYLDSANSKQPSLKPADYSPHFLNLDPLEGISLRNFHLQITKWAAVSNIALYVSDEALRDDMLAFAKLISQAQVNARAQHADIPPCNTYIVNDPIAKFMHVSRHIVAVPPKGFPYNEGEIRLKNWDSNFLLHEGIEMSMMSGASPVGNPDDGAIWLGNTSDFDAHIQKVFRHLEALSRWQNHKHATDLAFLDGDVAMGDFGAPQQPQIDFPNWTLYVRCAPNIPLPSLSILDQYIRETLSGDLGNHLERKPQPESPTLRPGWKGTIIDFPSSGSFNPYTIDEDDCYTIVSMCKLLYVRSKAVHKGLPTTSLLFCNDGYTETSFLALCYLIYSTGVTAPQAWVDLHKRYSRAFFSFQMDAHTIYPLQKILLQYSPAVRGSLYDENYGAVCGGASALLGTAFGAQAENGRLAQQPGELDADEDWFAQFDGSFPSVILPHVYLGSLVHANNPKMLATIGIKRVISVGEVLNWVNYDNNPDATTYYFEEKGDTGRPPLGYQIIDNPYPGISKLLHIKNIQDNGLDSLTPFLATCLEFLDDANCSSEPTLVHCRVGVSRSATVCIAEVMKRLSVGLSRAYLFVRVRRLNVIIQPHLRFMFELAKWEEEHRRCGQGWLREVDWPVLCREIAVMNRAYIPENP